MGDPKKESYLRPGMPVSARYGPGWFSGEISRRNEDGTYVVLYADGDIRTAVPADNIKILLADGTEVLATKIASSSNINSSTYTGKANDGENWRPPSNDTFAYFGLEASKEAFSSLYHLISKMLRKYNTKASAPEREQPAKLLLNLLKILDVNVQLLLTREIDISELNGTTVKVVDINNIASTADDVEETPLLVAYKDILQRIVSQKNGDTSFGLQEAASKTLTLGLDLWFSETYQQLELLNAILNDKSRLLNVDTSKAYSLLLNQFTRHSTVS